MEKLKSFLYRCIHSRVLWGFFLLFCSADDVMAQGLNYMEQRVNVIPSIEEIEAFESAYGAAKDRETSYANRMLTAATMAATGIGGMMLAQGLAEQKADKDAEQDMSAYLATFQCKIGNKGAKTYVGGTKNIETPGANQLIDLYTEYAALATSLKERKELLGMKPGIESEVVIDKSTTGLYDDVGNGLRPGAYASIARALQDPDGEDAKKWATQVESAKSKTKTGGIIGGVGAVGGAVGNIAINHIDWGGGLNVDTSTINKVTNVVNGLRQ